MLRSFIRRSLLAPVMASALGLWGCGGESLTSLTAGATQSMAKNDPKGAVVKLKAALQLDEKSPGVRFLLGKALLQIGDPVAADVELRKALDLGHPKVEVIPLAATALVQIGKFERLLELYGKETLEEPEAQATLKTKIATAQASVGKTDDAKQSVKQALAAVPGHIGAQLLQSRLLVADRDYDGALALLDSITAKKSDEFEAYQLIGDIRTYFLRDDARGMAAYRKSLELRPNHLPSHAGALVNLFDGKDLNAVQTQLEALRRVYPNHPQTQLFSAMLAFRKGEHAAAKEILLQLLRFAPENPQVLQLAGANEYYLNSLRQAEAYLVKAVQLDPTLTYARSLLATTQLRQGQAGKAVEILKPVLSAPDVDLSLLFAAGEAYLQLGEPALAEALFARAAKGRPDDPRSGTALALMDLAKGKSDLAFAKLQDISRIDKGVYADMALISAHMRKKDAASSLKAIAVLAQKQPDKPTAPYLKARVLLSANDTTGAYEAFTAATKIDPDYFPAIAGMAALDVAANKLADAQKRFEELVKRDPKQTSALLALADVKQRMGKPPAEVLQLLQSAVKAAPTDVAPRVALFEHHLARKDWPTALTTARDALSTIPDAPELVAALGRAHLTSREYQQAVSTFKKLAALQPSSPEPHLMLSDTYVAMKDNASAIQSLRRALELAPTLLTAHRGLMTLTIAEGKTDEALAMARNLQRRWPGDATGFQFEGDIQMSRKNFELATRAFRSALAVAPTTGMAIKVNMALLKQGQRNEADKFTADWLGKYPKDSIYGFYVAESAMARNDFAEAETRLRTIVKLKPDGWPAWNNLAWTLFKLKKPDALEAAQKAYALAPKEPEVLDTMALVLSSAGKASEALPLQKKAVELAPANNLYRLHLAGVLIRVGDKSAAKVELEKLAYLGTAFSAHAEVAELMRSLQ
jgi:cellulose synthase operon protein C